MRISTCSEMYNVRHSVLFSVWVPGDGRHDMERAHGGHSQTLDRETLTINLGQDRVNSAESQSVKSKISHLVARATGKQPPLRTPCTTPSVAHPLSLSPPRRPASCPAADATGGVECCAAVWAPTCVAGRQLRDPGVYPGLRWSAVPGPVSHVWRTPR